MNIWLNLPSTRCDELTAVLGKIAKKAARSNCPAPTVEFGVPCTKDGSIHFCSHPDCAADPVRTVTSNRFYATGQRSYTDDGQTELVGEGAYIYPQCGHDATPSIPTTYTSTPTVVTLPEIVMPGGYTLAAHITAPTGGVLSTLDKAIVSDNPTNPADRSRIPADLHCEHCNTRRSRSSMVVLTAPGGAQVTVGSTCIDAYLEQPGLRRMIERPGQLTTEMTALVFEFSTRSYRYSVALLVATTVAWVRNNTGGVYQASQGWGAPMGTAGHVQAYVDGDKWITESIRRGSLHTPVITDEVQTKAFFALWWATTLPADSVGYLGNLRTAARAGEVSIAHRALVCSIVLAFDRECGRVVATLQRAKEQASAAAANEPAGEIGTRMKGQRLTVLAAIYLGAGDYGDRYLLKFADDAGHAISWFTGSKNGVEVGEIYEATYTVKAAKEYKGTIETIVSRAKLSDEAVGHVDSNRLLRSAPQVAAEVQQ